MAAFYAAQNESRPRPTRVADRERGHITTGVIHLAEKGGNGGVNVPTLAETQLNELTAWLVASSQDEKTPFGDTIIHDDYAQLLTVALDDPAPDLSAAIALGCLPLLVAADVPATAFAAIEGQAKLDERAQHIIWLSGAAIHDPMRGFPAGHVVRAAERQTLRQAAAARGIDPEAGRLIVGIPIEAFAK